MSPASEDQWRERLTPEQYRVLREKGTDRPLTGKYVNHHQTGMYLCAACGQPLFSSDTKFESGSGWPSFYDVVTQGSIELHEDTSHGLRRIEVVCAKCGSHLGHLFDNSPDDKAGKHYCVNSTSLQFQPTNE